MRKQRRLIKAKTETLESLEIKHQITVQVDDEDDESSNKGNHLISYNLLKNE